MKISENTLNILKNFSAINQSILVRPGKTMATTSATKTILASADVEEDFPTQFCIFELPKFLGVVSLFDSPDFEFGDNTVTISSGKKKTSITYAAPATIVAPPAKGINFPEAEVEFNLQGTDLNSVARAASVMQLPELALSGRDGTIYLEVINSKVPTADSYSIAVGETEHTFKMIIKTENIKMVSSDYHVSVSSKGIIKFKSDKLTYFVVTESTSSFGG